MLVVDMKGIILRCNRATYRWFIAQQRDLIGKPLYEVIGQRQNIDIDYEAILNLGKKIIRRR
ncbi:MAG: hypothetical protein EOM54_01265 [Clostridia bacterium]|nr:hypothetical protein [Clostridia bacterium]